MTAAAFVGLSFNTVSLLILLGFIIIQYIAICLPMQHMSLVQKKRVAIFIALAWLITVLGGCIPFFTLLALSEHCDGNMLILIFNAIKLGANCCICFMAFVYTLVILICIRIYVEVRQLRKRLSQFRYDQEVHGEREAFFTTLMLIALLTLFYIPFTTVFVISINKSGWSEISNSVVIYYMNLLPYVKFFLDPLIYGLRMKEMREGCLKLGLMCAFSKCMKQPHHHGIDEECCTSTSLCTSRPVRMQSFTRSTGSTMNRYVFKSGSGAGAVLSTTET